MRNAPHGISSFDPLFAIFLFAPAPMFVVENKKIYFALSKEVSLGFGTYAEHRLSFEYTYVLRDYNSSQLRLSYNYDLYPNSILNITIGAGYFNDTKAQGYFPQVAFSAVGINTRTFFLNVYLKARETFTVRSYRTNIFDLSFGVGLGLAPFGAKERKGFNL